MALLNRAKNFIKTLRAASGYEVSDLKVVQLGNTINDYQLGFKPPSDNLKALEVEAIFDEWLMMYSSKNIDDVWAHLMSLDTFDIDAYADTPGENRIYRITNFDWADGTGNTFRAGQRDVVTGKDLEPGMYNLYVATRTSIGIIGIAEADKYIDLAPYPKTLSLVGTGENISDYGVSFESFDHAMLTHNFVFYSKEVVYEPVLQGILSMTRCQLETLAEENKGVLTQEKNATVCFNKEQKSVEGDSFDAGVYYVYVAAVGDAGILGLSNACEMIITADMPEAKTEHINGGKGTVFVVGGATHGTNYQYMRALFDELPYTPKVAVFSSSREDMATVINHYFFEDPDYGALENDWLERGFEPIFMPLAADSRDFVANHPYYAALVQTADAVWLQGGDQNKHAKSLLNDDGSDTPVMAAIRCVYNRGGVVGGTSAGMHVMSQPSFGYGTSVMALQSNATEVYGIADIQTSGNMFPLIDNNNLTIPGLDMMPDSVLNDTHFDGRGRLGRLMVALRDTGKTIGLGADDGTAMAISEGVGSVNGAHGLFVVDVSRAAFEPAGEDTVFGVSGVVIHYLTEGDRYDFIANKVMVDAQKEHALEDSSVDRFETNDIFESYGVTNAMMSLVYSDRHVSEYAVKCTNFVVKFHKNSLTKVYEGEKTSIVHLNVAIKTK